MIKDERAIFMYLNKCLKEENLALKVICVGGFVLSHYGMRTTMDIDAFYKSTKKIESIIGKVGEHFSINNQIAQEGEVGYMAWFDHLPNNLLSIQSCYREIIK